MTASSKKSFLATSLSLILASTVLIGCGGSDNDDDNSNDPDVVNPNPAPQVFDVQAYSATADFTPVTVASWQPSPLLPSRPDKSDEKVIRMSVQNGEVVAINRWHNSVVKIDDSTANTTVVPEFFATLMTAEHRVDSSEDDIISGASEHLLTDVQYTEDNQTMYALVRTPRGDAVQGDDTYGLFKVGLNADGSIPITQVKGFPVAHRGSNVQRIADAKFTAMLPIDNGSVLVLDDTNNAVRYYDNSFTLQEDHSFALAENESLESWSADEMAIYMVVESESNDTKQYRVEKRLIATPNKVEATIQVAKEIEGIVSHNNHLLVVTSDQVMLLNETLTTLSSTGYSAGIDDFSVSPNFDRAAIIDNNDNLTLLDIDTDSLSAPIKVKFDEADDFDAFTLEDAKTLYYSSTPGEIEKLNLDQPMNKLSDQQVIEQSLADININDLNYGYPSNAVRYDLGLSTSDINLPITYTWTSSDSSVIDNTGKVASLTGQSKEVVLTVTGSTDDGSVTSTREFTFEVLPTTQIITNSVQSNLKDTLDKKYLNYTNRQFNNHNANIDGSLYVLNEEEGYALLQKQADNTLKAVLKAPTELFVPTFEGVVLKDSEIKQTLWQDTDTLWMLIGGEEKGVLIKKTFTDITDLTALETDAKTSWAVVETYDKPIVTGLINPSKTHISIVQDKGNEEPDANGYQVSTYDVASGNVISDYAIDINLYRANATIDDSGDYIFFTDDDDETDIDSLYRYVKGVKDSSIEVNQNYYSGAFTVNGDLVVGGRNGQILFVKQALSSPLSLSNANITSFGRENYNGTKSLKEEHGHNTGRVYTLDIVNGQLFVSYSYVGTSIVDISNFDKPVEVKHIPYEGEIFLGTLSGDGKYLLQISRYANLNLTPIQ